MTTPTATKNSASKSAPSLDEPTELDPVCGVELSRGRAAADAYFESQRFFFCSEACKCRFDQEPARYFVSCIELA